MLTNVSTLATGPILAWTVATRLTPETQGYYYSFGAVLAFLSVAEAGLSQIVIILVAQIPRSQEGSPQPAGTRLPDDIEQLRRITWFALRRFAVWGGAGTVALGAIGGVIFSRAHSTVGWAVPWATLCLAGAANFVLLPLFAMLQGLGHVESYWFFRCVQQLAYGLVLIGALLVGLGLGAPVAAAGCMFLWAVGFLAVRHGEVMRQVLRRPQARFKWTRSLSGLQGRVAGTQLAGFLGPQALVPLCFVLVGPVPAGRLGLTWSLSSFVQALGQNVVLTRFPALSRALGVGAAEEAPRSPLRLARVASVITVVGGACVALGVMALGGWRPQLASRVLPTWGVMALVSVASVTVFVMAVSSWFRAQRRDPLALFAMAGAVAGVVGAAVGGAAFGLRGLIACFVGANVTINLAGLLIVLHRDQTWERRN